MQGIWLIAPFAIAGLLMLGFSFNSLVQLSLFMRRAAAYTGVVIGHIGAKSSTASAKSTYHAVVQCIMSNGETRKVQSAVSSNPPSPKIGKSVTVLIDHTSEPEIIKLKTFSDLLIFPVVGLVFGVFFVVFSFYCYYNAR